MTELEREINRQRLKDELRRMDFYNVAQIPDETYEQNLTRRARLEIRRNAILKELSEW